MYRYKTFYDGILLSITVHFGAITESGRLRIFSIGSVSGERKNNTLPPQK